MDGTEKGRISFLSLAGVGALLLETTMTISISPAIMAAFLITGLGVTASLPAAAQGHARGLELIQYDRYGNQPPPYGYGAQNPPPNAYDNRNQPPPYGYGAQNPPPNAYDNRYQGQYGNDDRDYRGGALWRPGQVLPPESLNRVVFDWEERGLSRPPGGHEWVRVGLQFILVRQRDRMIARILNFN
jgi:Ni/Co efflux regulator RcnB